MTSRRTFLASSLAALPALAHAADEKQPFHLATNVYPWLTFYGREKRDFNKDLDVSLEDVVKAGLDGLGPILNSAAEGSEPILNSAAEVKALAPKLKKHGLQMRSAYLNAKLHDKDAPEAIKAVVSAAEEAGKAGLKIAVVNPTPLRWGGSEDKSDEQLTR